MAPSREELEGMKRTDLQKICKDYGVRANLKTEALINMVVEASQNPPSARSSVKPVSTRTRAVSRQRGQSSSSLIVHDTDDEEDQDQQHQQELSQQDKNIGIENEQQLRPRSTRKGKDTQTRLGVGRPVAAGGAGPRAVTTSSARSKRAKSSRALRTTEATIPEEEPETEQEQEQEAELRQGQEQESHNTPGSSQLISDQDLLAASTSLLNEALIAEAVRPLREELETMKKETQQIPALKAEIERLTGVVADMKSLKEKHDGMSIELENLRGHATTVTQLASEVERLRVALGSRMGGSNGSSTLDPFFSEPSTSNRTEQQHHPGIAASTLGKRHRDSTDADLTGVIEQGEEGNYSAEKLAKTVVRPNKKRPKTSVDNTNSDSHESEPTAVLPNHLPSFTVYTDSRNYDDPPPPTDRLPDFYTTPSSPDSIHYSQTSSTAHQSENNPQAFAFSFQPYTSTPAGHLSSLPSFPYPEPPSSPSPTHQRIAPSPPAASNRTDVFQSFGLPPPNRPSSRMAASAVASGSHNGSAPSSHYRPHVGGGGSVNPAMLSSEPTSNQVAAGLGLTRVATTADLVDQDTARSQPTMYGTETDSRFGDFGVEGVASGFWAGGR